MRLQGLYGSSGQPHLREAAEYRFGFDVEALFLARKFGFRISELPVTCVYHAGSSVNRVGDVLSMLGDVRAVRWKHRG